MAVNNDEELDLQIPENNDMLLFTEDLVKFSMPEFCRKNNFEWVPTEFYDHSYNTSVPIIRRAIDFIESSLVYDHENLYRKMKKANLFNSNSYERLDKIIVANCFPGCFEAKYFLLYCVNLLNIGDYFYIEGTRDTPDLAKQYIYQFLQKYVTAEGWDAICRIAEDIVKMLRDFLNEPTTLDISPVSDDIEHQGQEVSSESSSSSGEEASASSRHPRSNITFQRGRAYINIKEYLKLYTKVFPKDGCEIGLCSLREQQSPSEDKPPRFTLERNKGVGRSKSDDKPRPSASYFDQELIIIIAEYKIKTHMLWNKIKLIDRSNSD